MFSRSSLLPILLLASAGAAQAQPSIAAGGVMNAASYAGVGLSNSGIAQGAMFVVFGTNLGPASLVQASSYPLPTSQGLGGTSMRVTSGGQTLNCIMIYTSARQAAAVLPSATPVGNGQLTVTYNGQTSAPAAIQVVRSAFGMFTLNERGSGPGVVQNYYSPTQLLVNIISESAQPGQTLIAWGTGLGPVAGNEAAGPLPGDLQAALDIEVYVGGKRAAVTYAGRSGCCAGIDQVVFVVPDGVEGCYVPLVIKSGSAVSNFVTVSVSRSTRVCQDRRWTEADFSAILAKGALRLGQVLLTRTESKFSLPPGIPVPPSIPDVIKTDAASGAFLQFDMNRLVRASGLGGVEVSTMGSCMVFTFTGDFTGVVDPVLPDYLDAGAALSLAGPKGTKQLPALQGQRGVYGVTLGSNSPGSTAGPEYLEAGQYTVSGPGGADVGAFSLRMTVPEPFQWTNRDNAANVNRATGHLVTWTGGGAGTTVSINGVSVAATRTVGTFTCVERSEAGRFLIPSYVLLAIPLSQTSGISTSSMTVGTSTQPVILRNTANLDILQGISSVAVSTQANYR